MYYRTVKPVLQGTIKTDSQICIISDYKREIKMVASQKGGDQMQVESNAKELPREFSALGQAVLHLF